MPEPLVRSSVPKSEVAFLPYPSYPSYPSFLPSAFLPFRPFALPPPMPFCPSALPIFLLSLLLFLSRPRRIRSKLPRKKLNLPVRRSFFLPSFSSFLHFTSYFCFLPSSTSFLPSVRIPIPFFSSLSFCSFLPVCPSFLPPLPRSNHWRG